MNRFCALLLILIVFLSEGKPVHAENRTAQTPIEILELYKKDVHKRLNRPVDQVRPYAASTNCATVSFLIAQDGNVSKIKLDSSSGNKEFDDSCLNSVRLRAPFRPFTRPLEFKAVFKPLSVELSITSKPASE